VTYSMQRNLSTSYEISYSSDGMICMIPDHLAGMSRKVVFGDCETPRKRAQSWHAEVHDQGSYRSTLRRVSHSQDSKLISNIFN